MTLIAIAYKSNDSKAERLKTLGTKALKGFWSLFHRSKRFDLTGLSDYQLRDLGLRRDQINAISHGSMMPQVSRGSGRVIKADFQGKESLFEVPENRLAA